MFEQALIITFLGMGSVFFFLILMICMLNVLRIWVSGRSNTDLSKIAAAIVVAKQQMIGGRNGK